MYFRISACKFGGLRICAGHDLRYGADSFRQPCGGTFGEGSVYGKNVIFGKCGELFSQPAVKIRCGKGTGKENILWVSLDKLLGGGGLVRVVFRNVPAENGE